MGSQGKIHFEFLYGGRYAEISFWKFGSTTLLPHACCKLFQQVVTCRQMASCNSLILTDLLQNDKIDKFVGTC